MSFKFFINVIVLGKEVLPQLVLAVKLSLTEQRGQHQRPFTLDHKYTILKPAGGNV